jgi:hypothetical protein
MIDPDKLSVLTELVREARANDRKTFESYEKSTVEWKAANRILTERKKVLDDYVQGCINEVVNGQ